MPIAIAPDRRRGERFERLLADVFRAAGWRIAQPSRVAGERLDLVVRRGKLAYGVQVKSASEGRRDRLIPLLAQAILEAQAAVRKHPSKVAPLAVVAAARVPDGVADEARWFVSENAPGIAVGVMDLEGFRAFLGHGLEGLNAPRRPRPKNLPPGAEPPSPQLFSDLNQWMLKVLLAPRVREELLAAPRGEYRNASQLAKAAGASIMSAFRLLRMLGAGGFLDESDGPLRLVRLEDLMRRWRAAYLRPVREWPMRWILRGDPASQLQDVLRTYARLSPRAPGARQRGKRLPFPQVCLSLFAAADALGFGFVRGVKPHIYVEEVRPDVLKRLGLSRVDPGHPADVLVRIPVDPQSVFRGSVLYDGVPVSDILQVWLDVADHPSRGEAQAREIQRRALGSLFTGK